MPEWTYGIRRILTQVILFIIKVARDMFQMLSWHFHTFPTSEATILPSYLIDIHHHILIVSIRKKIPRRNVYHHVFMLNNIINIFLFNFNWSEFYKNVCLLISREVCLQILSTTFWRCSRHPESNKGVITG